MTMVTLDAVQKLADQLPARDQLQLITYLTQQLAQHFQTEDQEDLSRDEHPTTFDDLWRQLDDPSTLYVSERTATEELDAMRR